MNEQGNTRDPTRIEADIEQTRNRVSDTLDALQGKLSVGEMVDEAVTRLRGSGADDYVRNLGNSVRDNPLPTVLIGAGIAWLMMSGRNDNRPDERGRGEGGRTSPVYSGASDSVRDSGNVYGHPAASTGKPRIARVSVTGADDGGEEGVTDRLRDAADSVAQTVSDGASSAARSVSDAASGVLQSARDAGRSAAASLSDARHQVEMSGRRGVATASRQLDYVVNEQPLALGALGFALGAALGAGLPATRREDEMFGEQRDSLVDEGRDQVGRAVDTAKEAASAAASAAADEANAEGVHIDNAREVASQAAEKVKKVASAARDAAEDKVAAHGDSTGPSRSSTSF